jgi:septal ring factor EnvC (AmiA/AmiB activator)
MMRIEMILGAIVFLPALAVNTVQTSEGTANPIRKVVTMLQNMQNKVAAEGEKEEQLFEKFMCYCKSSDNKLALSISSGENKVSELGTSIEAHTAEKAQLEQELKDAKEGRAEAKSAMKAATALREKEEAGYSKDSAMLKSNIEALGGAIAAIEKGMGSAFLQTTTAATVRKIALNGPAMSDADRQDLMAFLSGGQSNQYVPQSGQITGILKGLKDEMEKSLADATGSETSSIQSYDGLMAAKTKQVEALTAAIEAKSNRDGNLAVTIAQQSNDREDTSEALAEDKKFLADLSKNCQTKQAEWDEISKMRAAELVALADTIKALNDDDALELFKKALPSASFIQLESNEKVMRTKALAVITLANRNIKSQDVITMDTDGRSLDFVALALKGKKIGFGKVIKMIDSMVAQLKVEQDDDDKKKDYCEKQFDASGDTKKGQEQKIADLETAISDAQEGISTTKSELEALADGIKALDKSVADATEQRKEEHADYTELMANDASAKELLAFAQNRLNKFYKPELYKAPPKSEASEALVQDASSTGDAPPPAPEAPGPFKKNEESKGVIAMIEKIIKDLDKEMQTAEVEEKEAQKEYEEMMGDSAAKRAQDSELVTEKESIKAELESELESSKSGKLSTTKELMGTLEYMSGLHKECDWLLKYFDVRKEARVSEIDALDRAKQVLNGADISFVQRKSLRAHRQF